MFLLDAFSVMELSLKKAGPLCSGPRPGREPPGGIALIITNYLRKNILNSKKDDI